MKLAENYIVYKDGRVILLNKEEGARRFGHIILDICNKVVDDDIFYSLRFKSAIDNVEFLWLSESITKYVKFNLIIMTDDWYVECTVIGNTNNRWRHKEFRTFDRFEKLTHLSGDIQQFEDDLIKLTLKL